jgi:hypothetical protein
MALFDELYEQGHGFLHAFYLVLHAFHDTLIVLLRVWLGYAQFQIQIQSQILLIIKN